MKNPIINAAASLLLILPVAAAAVRPAPVFQDGVVLQRDRPVPVWGTAEPREEIVVEFAGQRKEAEADEGGKWRVDLDALPASAEAGTLKITGTDVVTVGDVLVGEVWICGGQSNMEWTVDRAGNAEAEVAGGTFPLIRHFKVERAASEQPLDQLEGKWVAASPATVGDFSAVGYFFGRELFGNLDVPIGLVNSSYGGTEIEAWMSAKGLAATSVAASVEARWQERVAAFPADVEKYEAAVAKWETARDEARADGHKFAKKRPREPEGRGTRKQPSTLYNAMINPLIPFAARGVIWYQGEANQGRSAEYAELFPGMISQWRGDFEQPGLPFYFVQLANNVRKNDPSGEAWGYLREAQTKALELPATGMAVAVDIGESDDIHPKNKQEVGRRLALLALANVYDRPIEFAGPRFAGTRIEDDRIVVEFANAEGLELRAENGETGFAIAGADLKFRLAAAEVKGGEVWVGADEVPSPTAVRYAWANDPIATLFNGSDLPTEPFRTDEVPEAVD